MPPRKRATPRSRTNTQQQREADTMMTDGATDSSLKRARSDAESSPERQAAESAQESSRPRLDHSASDTTSSNESGASLSRLASVEVQLIMQCLDQSSLLRLARCSRQTLADADHPAPWKSQGILALGRHASYDIPQRLSGLMRNRPVLIRWTFTSRATESEEITAFEKLGNIRNLVRLELDGGQNIKSDVWSTRVLTSHTVGRLEYIKLYGRDFPTVSSLLSHLALAAPNLRSIEFSIQNQTDDAIQGPDDDSVGRWPHLRSFKILASGESGLADDFLVRLGRAAPALSELHIDGESSRVSLDGISSMRHLSHLRLKWYHPFSHEQVECIRACRHLRLLDPYHQFIDPTSPPIGEHMLELYRGEHMRTVEELSIYDAMQKDDVDSIAASFEQMPALRLLRITRCAHNLLLQVHRVGTGLQYVRVRVKSPTSRMQWLKVPDLRRLLTQCGERPESDDTAAGGSRRSPFIRVSRSHTGEVPQWFETGVASVIEKIDDTRIGTSQEGDSDDNDDEQVGEDF